jgi:hypothetical protein
MLGDTLVATQAELKLVTPVSLAIRSATVQAPLQHYGPERVTQARQDMARIGTPGFPFLEAVEAYKITDLQSRRGSTLPLEVQAIRLNQDVAIVAVPGELFAELGLLIKRSSPFRMTVVIELANDNPAYIPTVKAFQEGGYETINSRVRPTSGEMMVQAAINLLHGLARETSQ